MPGLQPKKTIVPIDFSDSLHRSSRSCDGDFRPDGEVHVIHVLAALSVMEPGLIYGTESDDERIAKVPCKHLDETLKDDQVRQRRPARRGWRSWS